MPKRSLKKRRTVELRCYLGQFSGCCGVGILHDFDWYLSPRSIDYENFGNTIYQKEMIPILRRETKKALKSYPVIYATVTDDCKGGKSQIAVMKKIGWCEENVTKSKHGNYRIHVLSAKR